MPNSTAKLDKIAKIWIAYPKELLDDEVRKKYLALLDHTELARYQRFHFDRDRMAYLAAHALLRRALSNYAPVNPEAWKFESNVYGKPNLGSEQAALGLRFNLTHSKQLVACIITLNLDCGIDVESTGKLKDPLTITKRFFTETEYQSLTLLPKQDQDNRFTELWTLKEAYVKTLGQGLSASLKKARFDFGEDGTLSVTFQQNNKKEQKLWQFHRSNPDRSHKLSAAVRCLDAHKVNFELHPMNFKT